jgi:hypothetical protein
MDSLIITKTKTKTKNSTLNNNNVKILNGQYKYATIKRDYKTIMRDYKDTQTKIHHLNNAMKAEKVAITTELGNELFNTNNGEYDKLQEFYNKLVKLQSNIQPVTYGKLDKYIIFITNFLAGPAQTGDVLELSITTNAGPDGRNLIEEILRPHRINTGGKIKTIPKKSKQSNRHKQTNKQKQNKKHKQTKKRKL